MAFTTSTPGPITDNGNSSPGNPATITNGNIGEAALQTFNTLTPISLDSGGHYAAWGGTDPAGLPVICGIAQQAGSNLTTAAVGQPGHFGAVPNQPLAQNLYLSGPVTALGAGGFGIPFSKWGSGNRFLATWGNNGNSATPAITNVGKYYGLTKDSTTGNWYVDANKSTQGTNTACIVVGIDPNTSQQGSVIGPGTLVIIQADAAVVQNT